MVDKNNDDFESYKRAETPVFTAEEMSSYRDLIETVKQQAEDDSSSEPTDIYKSPTKPAPAALISYYSLQAANVLDEIDKADEQLANRVIEILEPFFYKNSSSQEIVDTLQRETETFTQEDTANKDKFWKRAEEILQYTISDLLKRLKEKLIKETDPINPQAIERHLRDCWNKVISPSVRKTYVSDFKKLILNFDNDNIKTDLTEAFVLSIINTLFNQEQPHLIEPSGNTISAFSEKQIILPENKHCTPVVFNYATSRSNHFIYLYLEEEMERYPTAKEALHFLLQIENFGIFPKNLEKFNEEDYRKLCKLYFDRFIELKEKALSPEIQGAMVALWNEIIGPQLVLLGEICFSDNFLLPKQSKILTNY